MDEEKAFENLDQALDDLASAGLSHLATTIRLTVENEVAREKEKA